ncbi:MAG: hypothetical protein JWS10_943 [Cypionkella sp.]|uniref:hypothetical protein n=1 Tax=Cypionkella sp. TaxID=2811411 RepID=UPI002619D53C|nr:hypothetical protein [Cypionkella sp.]MDB5658328.1 hypothetical protein [Cypionkella sp.]
MAAALFASVNGNGWSVTYPSPPTFAPATSPELFSVTRSGFDDTGAPISFLDDLLCMSRIRQPYSNQASLTADQVALSEPIYIGDLIAGGAVNNSTRLAPLAIPKWLNRDREVCAANTFRARLAVGHAHARAGRAVRAVKFIATDGTTTVTQTVTAMSVAFYSASGFSVPHYAADLDFTGFIAGAAVTIDAIIYPWVGTAFQASVDGSVYPSPNFTTLLVLNNRTGSYGQPFAYVDATLGNDSTGVASATAATAAALPFLTCAAACLALRTFSNTNYARNFVNNCIVRLVEGTHVMNTVLRTNGPTNAWPLIIEAADPTKQRTTILQDKGSTQTSSLPNQCVFRNITLKRGATGAIGFLDNAAANLTFSTMMAFENVHFDASGFVAYDSWIYRTGLCFFINCTQTASVGQARPTGVTNKAVITIGCDGSFTDASTTYCILGSKIIGGIFDLAGTTGIPASLGTMVGWSMMMATTDGGRCISTSGVIGARGFAILGVVCEQSGGVTSAVVTLNADGNVNPVENLLIMCDTMVGARTNMAYQDTGSVTVQKHVVHKFCSHDEYNMKSDTFGTNAALVGNWSVIYKALARGNAARRGDTNTATAPGVGQWIGEISALGDIMGTNAAPLNLPWVNDKSFLGAGGGGGDYTPTAGTQLPLIPAGQAPWSHDFMGRAIPNDGTGLAGALQMVAATGSIGTGAGTVSLDGAAAGRAPVAGGAVGTLPLTGAGTGAAPAVGVGAGAIPLAGAGAGATPAAAVAAGTIPLSGVGVGVAGSPTGAVGAGTLPLDGGAVGTAKVKAVAAGALSLGGDVVGLAKVAGVAAGDVSLGGIAAGTPPGLSPIAGGGIGSLDVAGSGQGKAPVKGGATGSIGLTGTSSPAPLIDWDRLLATHTPTRLCADAQPVAFLADARPSKLLETAA